MTMKSLFLTLISVILLIGFVGTADAQYGANAPAWFTQSAEADEIASIKVTAEQCSAYVADGTSEIDTTLENVRGAVALIHNSIRYYSTSGAQTGTAAEDSFTVFTVSGGDIYLYGLSMNVTTGAGATSELINFVMDTGTYGTTIVRLGEGKNLNDLASGIVQSLNPLTAVLTDSLAYYRTATMITNPVVEIIPWKIRLQSGTIIKLLMPGSSITTVATATMTWEKAEGSAAATVTAGL